MKKEQQTNQSNQQNREEGVVNRNEQPVNRSEQVTNSAQDKKSTSNQPYQHNNPSTPQGQDQQNKMGNRAGNNKTEHSDTHVGQTGKLEKSKADKTDWNSNGGDKNDNQQWDKGTGEPGQKSTNENNKIKSDKTVQEPEIDAPIYDPEKTEKKIPQMGPNK